MNHSDISEICVKTACSVPAIRRRRMVAVKLWGNLAGRNQRARHVHQRLLDWAKRPDAQLIECLRQMVISFR